MHTSLSKFFWLLATCLSLTLFVGGTIAKAKQATLANPSEWLSTNGGNNPLIGKIWSTKTNSYVDPSALLTELKTKQFIMLGETHDNPDHHVIQASIIKTLVNMGRKPNIVMEMVNVDQMRRLSQFLSFGTPKAEHLGKALKWKQYGWPDWKIYMPIGEEILGKDLKIFPGSPSIRMTRTIIKRGFGVLPDNALEIFQLDKPLEPALKKGLQEELRVAHCNKLPEKLINPMSNIQRFRDAWMADVMIQAEAKDKPAVLIAGSGHVRTDRGAPWYLRQREQADNYVSIQLVEVVADIKSIEEIASLDPEGKLAADYIWITPAVIRKDPCEQFSKRKQK